MTIREIRFGVRAVDTNGAAAGGAINSGVAGAPNEIQPGWIAGNTQLEFLQLLAFADVGADGATTDWGNGVLADTAFNLADMRKDGQVGTLGTDDTAADPVLLPGARPDSQQVQGRRPHRPGALQRRDGLRPQEQRGRGQRRRLAQ
jgi:hypothetical protein